MWAPFMDRVSLPNHPSCYDELDEAIQKLSSAISRCSFAGVSDDEIYDKIVRAIPITHEHISKEEERKRRPKYEGNNLREVLESVVNRLDRIEDKINV